MGEKTKIEWCDHTFNVVWGCTRISEGCRECYAATWSHRMGFNIWGKNAPRREMGVNYWRQPILWNRKAAAMGEVKLVFCSSMADVFEEHPTVNQERPKLWELIDATHALANLAPPHQATGKYQAHVPG